MSPPGTSRGTIRLVRAWGVVKTCITSCNKRISVHATQQYHFILPTFTTLPPLPHLDSRFFLFSFPTKLPGWKKVQKLRVNESVAAAEEKPSKKASKTETSGGAGESGKLARLLRPVAKDVGKLTRNYPFIALTFNQASEGFLLAVFSAFMPKFLESQFGAKPSDAAFFVGIIVGEFDNDRQTQTDG